jgi:saccharopine dehydrogenase (NAD+, L-lysine-forming)
MPVIGLIKEGKVPADNRVALTPAQCRWLQQHVPELKILVQSSPHRCYKDTEYLQAGIEVVEELPRVDILLGIKEVPVAQLVPDTCYLFFSHTRKRQPYNRDMFHAMMDRKITLIDYECLEHEDGQRIIGFGFFAGIVGAHNGIMAYGNRTGAYQLGRVKAVKDYRELIHTYFGLKLPPVKIAVTGSGRVAHGILEIMNLMDVQEVEPDDYIQRQFTYPVYVHLKGASLYRHKETGTYHRDDFHENPSAYQCLFSHYISSTDILMNGVYWEESIPRLFTMEQLAAPDFRIQTIADITDDKNGSIPCNLGDATIENPVYGIDRKTGLRTDTFLPGSVDLMAVGNLPNELPRDASRYFGEQLIKYILQDLIKGETDLLNRATILKNGKLTERFGYLKGY